MVDADVMEQLIGLAGYYQRFIKDCSKIASPLSERCGTLKKNPGGMRRQGPPKKTFAWGEEQDRAFESSAKSVRHADATCV